VPWFQYITQEARAVRCSFFLLKKADMKIDHTFHNFQLKWWETDPSEVPNLLRSHISGIRSESKTILKIWQSYFIENFSAKKSWARTIPSVLRNLRGLMLLIAQFRLLCFCYFMLTTCGKWKSKRLLAMSRTIIALDVSHVRCCSWWLKVYRATMVACFSWSPGRTWSY